MNATEMKRQTVPNSGDSVQHRFAQSSEGLSSSEIRDLMSLASAPDIISFAGGMPGNELFPLDEMDRIYNNLTESEKQTALQYGPTSGSPRCSNHSQVTWKQRGCQ